MQSMMRAMVAEDWKEVVHIYEQGIVSNMATFQTECPTYEAWDEAHIKVCRYVMEEQGKVVGWVVLSPVSGRCVYAGVAEVSIYIENSCKGKGYGEKLLTHMISESEKAGFWTLQSGIMSDNFPSLKLHQKCGFREVGYRERLGKDRYDTWRDVVLMEKRRRD